MFERFTDGARRVVIMSAMVAFELDADSITPMHLLFGLVRERGGVAAQVAGRFGLSEEAFNVQISDDIRAPAKKIPFAAASKKAIEFSLREALVLGHNYVGTEHILLGVIRVEDPDVRSMFGERPLRLEDARHQVSEFLRNYSVSRPTLPKTPPKPTPEMASEERVERVEDDLATTVEPEASRAYAWIARLRHSSGVDSASSDNIIIGCLISINYAAASHQSGSILARAVERLSSSESLRDYLQKLQAQMARATDAPSDEALHALCCGISKVVGPGDRVNLLHVFAAGLLGGDFSPDVAARLGCDRVELSLEFLRVLSEVQHDGLAEWTSLLAPEDLDAHFASDYVPISKRGPSFGTRVELRDKLGFDPYVTMLATMIARKSTAMPVSIGLFGEWGSGKSYFMQLLRQKVEWLTDSGSDQYFREIAQIHFNAWNYADTNLWASLAAEFFSQLAAPETDPHEDRRTAIAAALAGKSQIREEIVAIRDMAAVRTRELRVEYARASAAKGRSRLRLSSRLIGEVATSPLLRDQLGDLSDKLGFTRKDRERVLRIADDIQAVSDDLTATKRVLAQRSLLLPFILLVIFVGLVGVALAIPSGWWTWISSSGAVASLVALMSTIAFAVRQSRLVVDRLRQVAVLAQEVREKVIAEDEESAGLAIQLSEAEANEATAQTRLDELDLTIAQLDRQLLELSPGRRLYQFIADRAASTDYRSQLGVVSLVRRDFEHLVALMHSWKQSKESGAEVPAQPFDRIVLYIDDLDRCEPRQVVDVLQAVHLLLAMDLFVVVVGVDPRWLLRALRLQYRGVLTGPSTGDEQDLVGLAESTPQDYLEKIFQVPFFLPSMDGSGFGQLIQFLARSTAKVDDKGYNEAPDRPPAEIPAAVTPSERLDKPAPVAPDARSEVADVLAASQQPGTSVIAKPSRTPITSRELDLLTALAPLVRTPRAATRMFNIYGLLRSARDLSSDGRFLGTANRPGDFEAVIQLIGILTGAPRLLTPIVVGEGEAANRNRGLCRIVLPGEGWASFVDSLAPETKEGHSDVWMNSVVDQIGFEEVEEWNRIVRHLKYVRSKVRLDDLQRYQLWAPQVARFSFFSFSLADNT